MEIGFPAVRHVVAWLAVVRAATCAALWLVLAATWLLPGLDLSIRTIAQFVLGAAVCRTLVVLQARGGNAAEAWLFSVSLAFDAVLLTGLLDITGGPFNPFIVIYGTYIWIAVVTLSLGWASVVVITSMSAFGWLLFDHLQSGLLEHHRL